MKSITRTLGEGWKEIKTTKFKAVILSFDEPSFYGINEGRISKLWIRDNISKEVVCNYDRGFDITPSGSVMPFYREIVNLYN